MSGTGASRIGRVRLLVVVAGAVGGAVALLSWPRHSRDPVEAARESARSAERDFGPESSAALEALAHPSAVVARRPQRRRGLLLGGGAIAAAALVGIALYAALQHRLASVELPPPTEVTTALTPPAVTPPAVTPPELTPPAPTPQALPAPAPPAAAPSVVEAAVPAQNAATEPLVPAVSPARAEQRAASAAARAHPRRAAPPAAPEPAPPEARAEEDVRDVFFLDGPRPPQNSKE